MKAFSTIHPTPGQKLCLVAGEGHLPVHVAQNALQSGWPLAIVTIGSGPLTGLKGFTPECQAVTPGLVEENLALIKGWGCTHIVFAGKVDKWTLLRKPKFDKRAWAWFTRVAKRNDDALMLSIIDELENKEGLSVLPQTAFMYSLFQPLGDLTQTPITEQEQLDVRIGFELAKAMGGLDVGQTVVVHHGMTLAVEAIEGTDECLKRAGLLAKKQGGVVVKVAKPEQDQRFDVPAVGLRTLRTMKANGLKVLAAEAQQTLFLDELPSMIRFAEQHGIRILSI